MSEVITYAELRDNLDTAIASVEVANRHFKLNDVLRQLKTARRKLKHKDQGGARVPGGTRAKLGLGS